LLTGYNFNQIPQLPLLLNKTTLANEILKIHGVNMVCFNQISFLLLIKCYIKSLFLALNFKEVAEISFTCAFCISFHLFLKSFSEPLYINVALIVFYCIGLR
jgi:hypothetical protein